MLHPSTPQLDHVPLHDILTSLPVSLSYRYLSYGEQNVTNQHEQFKANLQIQTGCFSEICKMI